MVLHSHLLSHNLRVSSDVDVDIASSYAKCAQYWSYNNASFQIIILLWQYREDLKALPIVPVANRANLTNDLYLLPDW